MPSASLQSRIKAFESLDSMNNGHSKLYGGVRPTPLVLPRNSVQQHILDSDLNSPTADALSSIPPIKSALAPFRRSSPPALGRKTSLIDFSELASPSLKPVSVNSTGSTTSSTSASDSSGRPQLTPRVTPQVPSLPPRKPSVTSLRTSTTLTTPPPLPKRHTSSPVSLSSISSPPNNSNLLNAPESHTYPPASPRHGSSLGLQNRHMPSSSTSSFHSVSLSSDGGETHDSLDGSYEAVSSTAATSPTISTRPDWERGLQPTPKLPQRQWQRQGALSPVGDPVVSPAPVAERRPPPPPPQRRPVKPQPLPATHHRPAPPPPNVRKRYDALFERNLPQYSRKGRSAGWRGLSVDLLTNGEKPEFDDDSPKEERLDGAIIKCIWSCSQLPRAWLREIWSECDPNGLGSLNRDAFARGMWRIDETLSRSQQHSQKFEASLPSKPTTSCAPRALPPPLRKPDFLLR